MTEQSSTSSTPSAADQGRSAGALLRAARERRGMHIAALAAAIKVAPARLEALEADDYRHMPDTTFARALAQAVCRALKVDPVPVLALMPDSFHSRLERVDEGLNAPFREHGAGLADVAPAALWRHPVLWLAVALLAGAAAFMWWPRMHLDTGAEPTPPGAEPIGAASAPLVAGAASDPAATGSAMTGGVAPAVPAAAAEGDSGNPATVLGSAAPASAVAQAPAPTGALPILASAPSVPTAAAGLAGGAPAAAGQGTGPQVRAVQDSWVQVTDGSGKVWVARTMPAGEQLAFSGPPPWKLRIGNAAGTELSFGGQTIDLKALTRDNTVRLTLPPDAAAPAAAPAPAARPRAAARPATEVAAGPTANAAAPTASAP